jgi:two-component system chemotaxis response regulator CheY
MACRVLIVDDNVHIRNLLRKSIEHGTEWTVCGEAANGQDAVENVHESLPDVVILDFQMPVMDGLEAARQIGSIAPKTAMVMFTLHDHKQLLHEAAAVGIHRVFSKAQPLAQVIAWLKAFEAEKS